MSVGVVCMCVDVFVSVLMHGLLLVKETRSAEPGPMAWHSFKREPLSHWPPLSFHSSHFLFPHSLNISPPPLTSLPISPRLHWFRFFYIWVQTLFSCVSYCPTALHGSPVKLDHFLKRVWTPVCVHVCLAYMIPGKSPWCILHFPLMSCSVEAIIASDYFSVSHSGQPTRPQICREHMVG